MSGLWLDIRYGARVLLRRPMFTGIAVVTLALGIGANTAIFSVIYGVLLRPLPYQNGHELVVVTQQAPLANVDDLPFSVKEIEAYREQNQTLAEVVEHHSMQFILYGGAEPQNIETGVVSANFFDALGVKPLIGRTFVSSDEAHGAEPVMVLSYKYWQRAHGGDPKIIGRVFTMNARPHTVIGVLPPIPQYPDEVDVYMPTSACPVRSSAKTIADRNWRQMTVFGRLQPGVQPAQAQADVETIANRLQQTYPEVYPSNRGYKASVASLQNELTRRARTTFLVLLGTAGLVLFIACFNVANHILAHLMQRERELALRAALGASRARLIRQLLTENALLALAGGGLGILIAANGLDLLVRFAARFTTRAAEIKIDSSVLIFTVVVSLLTCLLFGLLPALSTKSGLATRMREGSSRSGSSRSRLRSTLVVAQVAVSFTLLVAAGLMLRSFLKLQQVDPGYNPERVMVMRLNPNWWTYTREQYRNFYRNVVEKIKNEPGVLAASISSSYPLRAQSYGPNNRDLNIEGRPQPDNEPPARVDVRYASPEFFSTIGLPLIKGRLFTEADRYGAPLVVVINQTLARHHWTNEDPLGKRISIDRGQNWATVVGVVGDVRQYGLEKDQIDAVYGTVDQALVRPAYLLARTTADPESLINQVRTAVHEVDPETVVDKTTTLEQAHSEALASPRLTTLLITIFALIALIITAAGIAGVMALAVNQRTHELGIRLALGATPQGVLWMVLRQGMVTTCVGLAIGSLAALALTRILRTHLFAVEPTDPLTFLTIAGVLGGIAWLACMVPARRVTRIDPMVALRSE